ncbi:Methylated-DNA--protein-cysteine methyltransferase [Chitinispirillum alkaliphilum]|nr:Methylated-DNA--protein-cysteine methyltransferase [Chitinispirillum alkaliphilum]
MNIISVQLNPRDKPDSDNVQSAEIDNWAGYIEEFLNGDRKAFPKPIPLLKKSLTPFQNRVLDAASKIEWGSTISYSELAAQAGNEKAVRAAASVMASNPLPLIIPCHRVIRSDGSIGGYMRQTIGKTISLKKKLLEREKSNQIPLCK